MKPAIRVVLVPRSDPDDRKRAGDLLRELIAGLCSASAKRRANKEAPVNGTEASTETQGNENLLDLKDT